MSGLEKRPSQSGLGLFLYLKKSYKMYVIGYAYPGSEIADKFGCYEGCAYISPVGKPIIERFPCEARNCSADGLQNALAYADHYNLEITVESRAWAQRIIDHCTNK